MLEPIENLRNDWNLHIDDCAICQDTIYGPGAIPNKPWCPLGHKMIDQIVQRAFCDYREVYNARLI